MPQNIPSDVQSASAGTTCQTTASNFAYIVTGTVLGVIVALCFAAIMLFYSVMASGLYRYGSARYMGTGPSDPGSGTWMTGPATTTETPGATTRTAGKANRETPWTRAC